MLYEELNANFPLIMDKFAKVKELLDEHNKLNLEREPYKLKYAAIELLKEIELDLNNRLNNEPEEKDNDMLTILLATAHLKTGLLNADTEELKTAEEQFMKCIDLLRGRELEPKSIVLVIAALNHLGIIWSQWSQPEKAKTFLDRAKQIYKDYTDQPNPEEPIDLISSFDIVDTKEGLSFKQVLDKLNILTLYYLAQVYGALKNHHKSAVYCHITLRMQLEQNEITNDLDYIEWALNAATLSQCFLTNEGFTQARHHLAAAYYILEKYEQIMKDKESEMDSEVAAAEHERFKHRSADVARCWAKYGILLLSSSINRLVKKVESEETDSNDTEDSSQLDSKGEKDSEKDTEKSYDDLKFDSLMDDIKPIVNQITDAYLLDFDDAKPVFLNVQKWLDLAKTYYTLENHASDYVEIIRDLSSAYKYLSFFEENEDRQAKMHKRRIDILEATVKELNPQYYKNVCRRIWIELSTTYSDILDIKLDRLRANNDRAEPQALNKINNLAKSAIKSYQFFLDSLDSNTTDGRNITFPADLEQPALSAYFLMGGLYNKMITFDKSVQLVNTQNSLNAYRFIIDYCETHPEAAEMMKEEFNLCKEIVNLLPVKINKLRLELMDK
ncbi:PREDICTED: KIF1-binding protein homolog [Polistes dominula]|uniref:KIF-binding protein n=1 Tax=Polistes dominula TaxID=743375 RepID=A0ABM1J9H2_POLDO|nr:PREDICTED: KIF1-binding protein homolog [Polistes dominula]